jgi:alkane 1-monooxygenase
MIPLAWFPPLWRRVMDHRVAEHYDGDLTRANIDPAKRARYLGAHAEDPYPDEPVGQPAREGFLHQR